MKNHFNQILWVLIILILMLWFYKIENSYSEMDRLKDTVDRQSALPGVTSRENRELLWNLDIALHRSLVEVNCDRGIAYYQS